MFSSEVIAFLNNYKMLENQVAHGKTENKRVSDMITNNQSKPCLLYTQRWIWILAAATSKMECFVVIVNGSAVTRNFSINLEILTNFAG